MDQVCGSRSNFDPKNANIAEVALRIRLFGRSADILSRSDFYSENIFDSPTIVVTTESLLFEKYRVLRIVEWSVF